MDAIGDGSVGAQAAAHVPYEMGWVVVGLCVIAQVCVILRQYACDKIFGLQYDWRLV